MNTEQTTLLQGMLAHFLGSAANAGAKCHADQIAAFVASVAQPWSRATLEGHLTASAWVLDRSRTHAALIHHRKLDRWLQPGGHIEVEDVSWRAAAEREVVEETGLRHFLVTGEEQQLFDVDVHLIPARPDVPEHVHYDLRFLFVAQAAASGEPIATINPGEAHEGRWFSLTTLANDSTLDPSLQRMVTRSLDRWPSYSCGLKDALFTGYT